MNCERANELDLVSYLSELGFHPAKVRGNNYWYHSPLREERTPSFKVNRKLNGWYDHGTAQGGSVVDFGISYFSCSVAEFLAHLNGGHFSFFRPILSDFSQTNFQKEAAISVTAIAPLSSPALLGYMASRKIDPGVAKIHCRQLNFSVHGKGYFGIGFPNQSGGWEIRNGFQKYAVSPKDFSLIKNGSDQVLVFEGFVDFLSFLTAVGPSVGISLDYLVLNGIGLFERARGVLERYPFRGLCFDHDDAGRKRICYALGIDRGYSDQSGFYKGFKDVNEWLVQTAAKEKISMDLVDGLPPDRKRQDEPLYHNGILPASRAPGLLRSRKGRGRGRKFRIK